MAVDTPGSLRRSALRSALLREAILEKLAWLRATPFWAISALAHLVLLLILLGIVVRQERRPAPADGEIQIRIQPAPAASSLPPRNLNAERVAEENPTRDFPRIPRAVPGPIVKTPVNKEETTEPPRGIESGLLDRGEDLDLPGMNAVIGPGPGAGTRWGPPGGTGTQVTTGIPGGGEDAVLAALDWLRRHQSPDGSWKARGFLDECKKTCRSVDSARHGDGRGDPAHDIGVTALAMLAFAGYGHTHRDGVFEEYVGCLRKAVQFMRRAQVQSNDPNSNGRYGSEEGEQWIYNHAIATLAMAELLVMSNDIIGLKPSVTDAVKLCLHAQNSGSGWRYGIKPGENDTSVTGWMVLALKTAKNARLDIAPEHFQTAFRGALDWFDRATASNGKTGYMAPGDEGSRLNEVHPEPYPFSKELSCMTAVGVLCRILAGESRGSPAVRNGVKILMQETPRWQVEKGRSLSTINMYYWYYGSYALFQYGGPDWKRWQREMLKALLDTQRQGQIDEDGSWDPIDEWGPAGGRVYSTAISALTLEVYQRARRLERGILSPPVRRSPIGTSSKPAAPK